MAPIELMRTVDGLEGTVVVTDAHVDSARNDLLRARLEIRDTSGVVCRRSYRLRASGMFTDMATGNQKKTRFTEDESPAEVNRSHAEPAAGTLRGGKLGGTPLPTGPVRGEERPPALVIDNGLLQHRHGFTLAEWRYARIESEEAIEAAQDYELNGLQLEYVLDELASLRRQYPSSKTLEEHGEYRYLRRQEQQLRERSAQLRATLRRHDICRCGAYWMECSDPACESPQRPWVDDQF